MRSDVSRIDAIGSRSPRCLLYGVAGGMDLQRHLYHCLRASMALDNLGKQFLAQVNLGLGIVAAVPLVLYYLKAQVIERPPHLVELVLGLHHDLVEPLLDRP